MPLEIMPRRVLVHISTTETQQVSTNGNSVLDCALLVKLLINTLKQCEKCVMDCVPTHSLRHKRLASIDNLCEIFDGIPRGIDTLIHWCLRISPKSTSAQPLCSTQDLLSASGGGPPEVLRPEERPVQQRSGLAATEEW